MPREVFAEEIEAFLERLDAVTAARVVANEAGEIERIYVTTESSRDDGTIRRAITSALMSQFSLPVDGWRVQIAHLAPEPQIEGIPVCQLVRLEETITEAMTRVVVDLRYEHDGAQKTITGSAQAPPGQAHRLRTVALATIEALRPIIERSGYRPSLEGVTLMPFAGATIALAAISLTAEKTSVLHVGAEAVMASEAEAVVGAVLVAGQKPSRPISPSGRGGKVRIDRREQFEGLRQHYERLIRRDAETSAPPTPMEGEPPESGMLSSGNDLSESAGASVATLPAEDVIQDLSEIRPERQGGAPVMREELRADGPSAAKGPGRLSVEDAFYRRLVAAGAPVYIRCRDGYEIPSAIVRDYGTYSLMVEVNGIQELVFKHGIIAIRPYGPLPPDPGTLS